MSYLLFTIYTALCCWLLTKIRFVKNAELGAKLVVAIFLLKLAAGIANGWIMYRTSYLADTWLYHNESIKEYHLLFSDPKEYVLNFFRSNYSNASQGLFQTSQSYWNDLKDNIIIKLLSVFDVFSFGNYYINVIFYNFIIFFGNVGLYRVFAHVYKDKKWALVISCFLLPSLLYFSSSIHKEGLILAGIGIIVFNFYYALNYTGFTAARMIYILLCLGFIFLLRNYVLIALLPALLAWLIVHLRKTSPLITFAIVYLVSTIIFFTAGNISPKLDFPTKVVERQQSFLALEKAPTDIPIDLLNSNFKSFAVNSPQALNHTLLRPYFTDIRLSKSLFPFSAEIFLYEILITLFFIFQLKKKNGLISSDPFILSGIFFSFSMFLIIGYTIPILGAIVRYRSIYLPFILAPVLCNFDWNFFSKRYKLKN